MQRCSSLVGTSKIPTTKRSSAENVVLRPKEGTYAIGNPRQGATMDVHEVHDVHGNGWACGFAYGEVNRCIWAQFHRKNEVTQPIDVLFSCAFPQAPAVDGKHVRSTSGAVTTHEVSCAIVEHVERGNDLAWPPRASPWQK
ncbi:hypothetical protein [Nannocystis pusilla]|uniref:hypothetical protein n=1 Tax=Nannocystis pusilla TaxID=889268 RepID=UPI003B7DE3D7